jgi:hypothetical protein
MVCAPEREAIESGEAMRAVQLQLSFLSLLLLLPAPALAAPPEAKLTAATEKAKAEIRKHYEDPIIEAQECPFPGLLLFTSFERANLAEDPIVPHQWFATEDGQVSRTLPLDKIRHHPKDEAEARLLAAWLFMAEVRWSRITETRVTLDPQAKRIEIAFQAEIGYSHPRFHQPRKPGKAIVTVVDGRWTLRVDDPFEPVDKDPR